MASSSHRKSGSSGRSTPRRRADLGHGTNSRRASFQPEVQVDLQGLQRDDASATRERIIAEGADSVPVSRRSSARTRTHSGGRQDIGAVRTLSPKQAERAHKRAIERRRLQIRVAAGILAVLGIWGLWTTLSTSRLFEIRTITVSGTVRVSRSEVTTLAAIPDGATLLNIDSEAVKRRSEERRVGKECRSRWSPY